MTERKPADRPWRDWVQAQIDEARAKGEFDRLPGAGRPLPGLDQPYDEAWWIKAKLEREGGTMAPLTLELRRRVERWIGSCPDLPSLGRLREEAEALNDEIRRTNRGHLGPLSPQSPIDVDDLCRQWRAARLASGDD